MDEISWCLSKKEGIRLIEPNSNLAEGYVKKAEDSLLSMRINQIREWKVTTAYYSSYFSVYAILQKIGVKCEIHQCTINFAKFLLNEFFNEEDIEFLQDSFEARKNCQYYIDRKVPDGIYDKMMEKAPQFLVKCKSILSKINEKNIKEIRDKLVKYSSKSY